MSEPRALTEDRRGYGFAFFRWVSTARSPCRLIERRGRCKYCYGIWGKLNP